MSRPASPGPYRFEHARHAMGMREFVDHLALDETGKKAMHDRLSKKKVAIARQVLKDWDEFGATAGIPGYVNEIVGFIERSRNPDSIEGKA